MKNYKHLLIRTDPSVDKSGFGGLMEAHGRALSDHGYRGEFYAGINCDSRQSALNAYAYGLMWHRTLSVLKKRIARSESLGEPRPIFEGLSGLYRGVKLG